jgi:hypothetical protein
MVLPMLILPIVAGCSTEPDDAAAASDPTTAVEHPTRPAETLPLPGDSAGLRSGNPRNSAATTLLWEMPSGWTEQPPSSNMRYAQYTVDGPGGPAQCVVFYFGPNQGGDPMANANRWAGQFSQPDGSSSVDRMQVEQLAGTRLPVYIVQVNGTYEGGMTGTAEPFQPQPNSMLLGGIAEGPDAPWFFKFTGPEQTVEAQRDAFIGMMSSIRPGN